MIPRMTLPRREFLTGAAAFCLAGCSSPDQPSDDTKREPATGNLQMPSETDGKLVPDHAEQRHGDAVCTFTAEWLDRSFEGDIAVDEEDMNTVVARHREQLLEDVPSESALESRLEEMDDSGAFPDVD